MQQKRRHASLAAIASAVTASAAIASAAIASLSTATAAIAEPWEGYTCRAGVGTAALAIPVVGTGALATPVIVTAAPRCVGVHDARRAP